MEGPPSPSLHQLSTRDLGPWPLAPAQVHKDNQTRREEGRTKGSEVTALRNSSSGIAGSGSFASYFIRQSNDAPYLRRLHTRWIVEGRVRLNRCFVLPACEIVCLCAYNTTDELVRNDTHTSPSDKDPLTRFSVLNPAPAPPTPSRPSINHVCPVFLILLPRARLNSPRDYYTKSFINSRKRGYISGACFSDTIPGGKLFPNIPPLPVTSRDCKIFVFSLVSMSPHSPRSP